MMKRITRLIKNNYKFILGIIVGLIISISSVYAIDAYIESNKVTYTNHNKNNVEEAIDELYEKSGVHKNKWTDPILNGADPVLKSPLIPVEIKNNGEVYYANENSEWYNYSEKRWANAVILIDNPSNKNYGVGDKIEEDDIESYFVWIPRYQYKIWNLGKYNSIINFSQLNDVTDEKDTSFYKIFENSKLIDIRFGTYETYPKMNEPTTAEVYYTHPAFTLGNKDLNGIWVGKFETGYKNATNSNDAEINKEESSSVIIKPDSFSWRALSIKNMFMNSYNYERGLDSHMLKNTEWGAVAYLSHSAYGIGTEISINNASDYKTGYASAPGVDQSTREGVCDVSSNKNVTLLYNTNAGYLASTTGNITGVYDMSGGAWDFVAGYKLDSITDSEFLNFLNTYSIYFDKYNASSAESTFNNRILGDATGEMGPFYLFADKDGGSRYHNSWYIDVSHFVRPNFPWFIRGEECSGGSVASQFAYYRATDEISHSMGFRIALAFKN